jgi:glyoxylase-like metal-dependent hydrolase (beta-lactamase superfamily II)
VILKNPPVEIVENLWMLGAAAYPIYLFKGTQAGTIFEGGTGPMGPVLREQLAALKIDESYVKQVVVTHAHPDHVMAVPLFREIFPEVQVLASHAASTTLSMEKAVGFFAKLDDALTGALIKEGMIDEQHRAAPLAEKQIPIDRTIKEGDTIDVDEGVALEVLETPGHSDCSLSFYEPGRKILIISDATGYYLPEYEFWWPNYFVDYGTYIQSMERLAGFGAEVLCLSHNAVICEADEVASYFERVLAATKAYHQRIVDEAKQGKSVREIAGPLGSEVYDKKPLFPLDFFQKNCALLVKNSLRHEGIEVPKQEPPKS